VYLIIVIYFTGFPSKTGPYGIELSENKVFTEKIARHDRGYNWKKNLENDVAGIWINISQSRRRNTE
jgi:hypothetical protein